MVSEEPISENNSTNFQFTQGPLSFTHPTEQFKIWKNEVEGRYIRIFIKGNQKVLSLAEVEVFGELLWAAGEKENVAFKKLAVQ